MKKNPFAGRMVLASGAPVEELRFAGQGERALSGSTGEINASDRNDLVNQIANLMQAVSSGQVVKADQPSRAKVMAEYKQLLVEAHASADRWQALGADIAVQIEEQRNREGFLARLMMPQNLNQGELPRVICQMWDAQAIVATGPSQVGFQIIRNKNYTPAEFELVSNIRVERLEIDQIGGQVLENAYNQGLDAMMVRQDRLWKAAADRSVGAVNSPVYFAGALTPALMMEVREGVSDHNLPTAACLLSNDFWKDMATAEWSEFLDPVTKYDLALNGVLGQMMGMSLITDGFRQPNQKVLNKGELYVVSTPEHHGCYSDRGGIRSEPTSGANSGDTTKGWLLSQPFSMTLANPRSVAVGRRIG